MSWLRYSCGSRRIRFEQGEGIDVGFLLRGVSASRCEGDLHVMARVLGGFLDSRPAAEHDQVGERHLLAALGGSVELLLDRLELRKRLLELGGVVDLPVLLGRKANARAVSSATLVGAPECRGRRPGGRNELRNRQAGAQDLRFRACDVRIIDQRMVGGRDRVLPDQCLLRNEVAKITNPRTHVAMGELEPGPRERVRELIRMLVEAPRDLLVRRVHSQRQIGRQHRRALFFDVSKASGTSGSAPLATHCCAPAGLFVSSHSYLNRLSKKWLLHFVGVCDQVTSGPPVIAWAPSPVSCALFQPRP